MLSAAAAGSEGNDVWATVVMVFFVLLWPALSVWFLRREDGTDDSGDDGGSKVERPGPDGPPWWPEFEQEFAAYVQNETVGVAD
jgi:hypothetical protein